MTSSSRSNANERPHTRVLMACTSCRNRKVRCVSDPHGTSRPCRRCSDKGSECVYLPINSNSSYDDVPSDDGIILRDPYAPAPSALPPSHDQGPAGYLGPHHPQSNPGYSTSNYPQQPPQGGQWPPTNTGRQQSGYPGHPANPPTNWNHSPPAGHGPSTYNGDSSHHPGNGYYSQSQMSGNNQNQYPPYGSQSSTSSRTGNVGQTPISWAVRGNVCDGIYNCFCGQHRRG